MSLAAVARGLGRDRIVQAGLILYVAAVLATARASGHPGRLADSLQLLFDPLLLATTFLALIWGWHRLGRRAERRFWGLLALAWLSWLLVEFIYFFEAGPPLVSASFTADLLYVLFYLNFALAVELKPHLRRKGDRDQDRRWLEAIAGLLAVFGLLIYFALVVEPEPLGLSLSFVSRRLGMVPNLLMRLSLDLLLCGRLVFAAATSTGRWPRLYVLLALAMGGFALRDAVLLLDPVYLGWGWGAFFQLPTLVVIVAARYRYLALGEPAAEEVSGESRRRRARAPILRTSPLALYLLVVPVVHLSLYAQGLLEEPSRTARDVFSLVYLLVVGGVAVRHQRSMDRERRRAIRDLEGEIEERKRINRELEQRQAELERFTYTISHELRAPLVTIHGFSGMLAKRLGDSGDKGDPGHSLRRIQKATSDMSRLLTELLELSRVGWVLHRRPEVDFRAVAERVRRKLAFGADELTPRIRIAAEMPRVEADEARLEDVLSNLVGNAIKFTPGGRRPEIDIGCRTECVPPVFFVRDQGRGIAAADREKVFGLFNRLDHPEIEGTGIGLALVKRIVETHGGRVWVESEGVGKGACFCFELPPPAAGEPRDGGTRRDDESEER